MKTLIGISIIAMLIVATYAVGRITVHLMQPDMTNPDTETVLIAGLIGWMAITCACSVLMAAYFIGAAAMAAVAG